MQFQDLAPLYEEYFCPFLKFFFGNFRSVEIFLRILEVIWEVFVKRLHIYCGASSWRDLKTMAYGLPAEPVDKWLSRGIKAAASYNSSGTIL